MVIVRRQAGDSPRPMASGQIPASLHSGAVYRLPSLLRTRPWGVCIHTSWKVTFPDGSAKQCLLYSSPLNCPWSDLTYLLVFSPPVMKLSCLLGLGSWPTRLQSHYFMLNRKTNWASEYVQNLPSCIRQTSLLFPSSQSYSFSSSHVWMWELDYEESWVLKNWCFWTVVLEKTLEGPFHCKEIQPVLPKVNQSWIFIGRTVAEAETPILWLRDGKNWLTAKDPDAGKDWRREEKGMTEDEMVGWHHQLDGREFE